MIEQRQWLLVFRRRFCLGMCSCLKPTNYGQRQCIGRMRRLIIPLVLLIPTLNRRMRCGLVKLVLLDRIHSSSPRTVGDSDRLSCCRKVKAVFMLDLQEITRVTVIECLRGLVRFRKHEMSRGRPPRDISCFLNLTSPRKHSMTVTRVTSCRSNIKTAFTFRQQLRRSLPPTVCGL